MQSELYKAVFLDRDGVLNVERGDYTWLLEDFRLNDGIGEQLLRLQASGYRLIVISNQGGIGKGLYSKEDVDFLHGQLIRVLAASGVTLDEIYYCPHHPATSKCICRKPESQMIEKAIARFSLKASDCWFIGDTPRDGEAALKAGVKPILIHSNSPLGPVVDLILKGEQ